MSLGPGQRNEFTPSVPCPADPDHVGGHDPVRRNDDAAAPEDGLRVQDRAVRMERGAAQVERPAAEPALDAAATEGLGLAPEVQLIEDRHELDLVRVRVRRRRRVAFALESQHGTDRRHPDKGKQREPNQAPEDRHVDTSFLSPAQSGAPRPRRQGPDGRSSRVRAQRHPTRVGTSFLPSGGRHLALALVLARGTG